MNRNFIDQLNWPAFLGLPIHQSASCFISPLRKDCASEPHSKQSRIEWLLIGTSFGFLAIFDMEFKILLQAFRLEGFNSITSLIFFTFDWVEISCFPFKKDIFERGNKGIAQIEHSKLFEDFFSQATISSTGGCDATWGRKHPLSMSVGHWTIKFLVTGKGYQTPHCSIWELSSNGERLFPLAVIYNSLATIHIQLHEIRHVKRPEYIAVPIAALNLDSLLNRAGTFCTHNFGRESLNMGI